MYRPTVHQLSAFEVQRGELILTRDLPTSRLQVALQYAIAKWVAVETFLRVNTNLRHGGAYTCGLCLHYDMKRNGCMRCPIGDYCQGTPYVRYNAATSQQDRLRHARREIEFLQKLYKEKYG